MNSDSQIRLQKYLSLCGVASRRHAEELIRAGIVEVNGKTVTQMGLKVDPQSDTICVRKRPVKPLTSGILLFNKPRSVITTMDDPEGRKTVADFLPPEAMGYFPAGRLDYHSSGLVVLTNDGDLASRLTHPRYGWERVYEAKVVGIPRPDTLKRIASGVTLEDGAVRAQVRILRSMADLSWLEVRIFEGRNRIVRRLLDAVRHPVRKLHRVKHGPFELGDLASGELRAVPQAEYNSLRRSMLLGPDAVMNKVDC